MLSYLLIGFCSLILFADSSDDSNTPDADDFIDYQVVEEQPQGHFVGNVVVDFGLDLRYLPGELSQLRFYFLSKNRNFVSFNSTFSESASTLFQIHQDRGIITTRRVIDREVVCPKPSSRCFLKLDVAVQPNKFFQILKVQIEVTDINDNSPTFPCPSFLHTISEAADEDTSFLLPTATDEDDGKFSVQNYNIVPSHGTPFELRRRFSWNEANIEEVRIVLGEKLDREKQDSYEFVVVASDGGHPCKSGLLNIKVVVLDANDNEPQFDKSLYELWVEENTPPGTVLLELHAEDKDKGANGQVFYSLSFNSLQEFGSLVGIGAESGQLYLKNELDYEKSHSTISLSVVAQDKGNDPLQSFASVLVHVQDVNDNQPHVSVTTLTSSGYAEVAENVEAGTFVAHLSVVDYDTGPCGQVRCEAMNEYFEVVRLYKSEFKLVTTREFSGVPVKNHVVTVLCSDCGVPQLTSSVNISIFLKKKEGSDEENVDERVHNILVEENSLTSHSLITLQFSGSALFKFVDSEQCKEFFVLNETSGEIKQRKMLDYEDTSLLMCKVYVDNPPDSPKVLLLRVEVIDRNDERPRFAKDVFVFYATSKKAPGQLVGRVRTVSNETDLFDSCYFSFVNEQESYLHVEKWTGLIKTKTVLRASAKNLKAEVGLYGMDSPDPIAVTEVIVHVLRPSDNKIFFLYKSSQADRILTEDANLEISEKLTLIDNTVAKFGIYDGIWPIEPASIDIASGNEEGYFVINRNVGLKVIQPVEACKQFTLNVTASTKGVVGWFILNVTYFHDGCWNFSDGEQRSASRILTLSDREEMIDASHPLASEKLSVVLSGVFVAVVIFVVVGLFLLFETTSKKYRGTSSAH